MTFGRLFCRVKAVVLAVDLLPEVKAMAGVIAGSARLLVRPPFFSSTQCDCGGDFQGRIWALFFYGGGGCSEEGFSGRVDEYDDWDDGGPCGTCVRGAGPKGRVA